MRQHLLGQMIPDGVQRDSKIGTWEKTLLSPLWMDVASGSWVLCDESENPA